MIKLTTKQLRNPEFLQLTNRIYRAKMSIRSAKRILQILKHLEGELTLTNELFMKLAEEHLIEREQKGSYDIKPGVEHEKAMEDFANSPIEINEAKITPQELFHVELSPSDMNLLDGLIDVTEQ